MLKILILGNKGQIGTALVSALKKENIKCTVLNNKQKKKYIDFKKIKKYFPKISKINPQLIINCIAYTDVENSEINKKLAKKINFTSLKYLAEFCKKKNVWLINFSTDYVFDGKKKTQYNEKCKMKPVNYYGYTKMLADAFMQKKLKKFFIFRVSWIYSKNSKRSFFYKIIKKINKKENIYVTSKEIGVPNSAYFIASILVKFIKILNTKKESLKSGIYNISNNGFVSRYAFAKKILKYFCIKSKSKDMSQIKILNSDMFITNVKRPNKVILSNNKIKKLLNLNIKSWENDLKKLMDREYEVF